MKNKNKAHDWISSIQIKKKKEENKSQRRLSLSSYELPRNGEDRYVGWGLLAVCTSHTMLAFKNQSVCVCPSQDFEACNESCVCSMETILG